VSDDRYRCSFDSVADRYERARPGYADDAVAWIAERLPFERVLDLAAGTGKLTRQLVACGADVVAVEPGDAMRALLERVVPEAQALAGSAEAIPLPDRSVDAVTVGQAFHWFRTGEALAEMHRVLRPGGGFALLWNQWDDDDPLLHELNELVEALRPEGTHEPRESWQAVLDASPLFAGLEERSFRHAERLDTDTIVDRIASVSAVAAAGPQEQAQVEARVRALVRDDPVDFPLITSVIVGDRV
jgi:ubiquinone/menaquinone biosynthesis C-methylase UbiE